MLEVIALEDVLYFVPDQPLDQEYSQWILDHLNANPLLELLEENE